MATNVYDLTDLAELNATVRALQFPDMVLDRWLPNVRVNSTEYSFVQNVRSQMPSAEFRSWDTESPIAGRPGLEKKAGQLPPISQKSVLSEYERIKLDQVRQALGADLTGTIYNDAAARARAIMQRVELAKGEVLSKGTVTINGNGLIVTVDYGIPGAHLVTPVTAWSDTAASTPIQDLMAWRDVYVTTNGQAPEVMLTSSRIYNFLIRNAEVRAQSAAPGQTLAFVGLDSLQQVLRNNLLPPVVIYDSKYKNGAGTLTRAIADDRVLLLPAGAVANNGEGASAAQLGDIIGGSESVTLGQTQFGVTAASLELAGVTNPATGSPVLAASDLAGVTITITKDVDPVQVWTIGQAVVLPVLTEPSLILSADVAA